MSDMCCATCRWFDKLSGQLDPGTGICRVAPPVVIPTQLNPTHNGNSSERRMTKPFTTWPMVRENEDWCSEHTRHTHEPATTMHRADHFNQR